MEEKMTAWFDSIVPWLLSNGIRIAAIIIVAIVLKKIVHGIIVRAVKLSVSREDFITPEARRKRENTLSNLFTVTLRTLIVIISGLMVMEQLGIKIGPILAAAGIVGLAFGFGGQYLIRDIITGLFIIMENQFRIGDVVNINGTGGLVEDVTLRKTTLRDLDGTVHHIPHGEIKMVSNLTKDFSRVNMNLGISYNSNLEHVIRVVNQVGNDLAQDPDFKDIILKPIQFLRVDDFADSSIEIKMLGETRPIRQWDVAGEFRKRLKIAFDKEGIEIPFPQRVLHYAKEKKTE